MPHTSRTAVELGNPEGIRFFSLGPLWFEGGLQFPSSWTDEEFREGECTFIYQGDRERYDIGFCINIAFEWNDKEGPDCIENKTLSLEGYMGIDTFRDSILPLIAIDELIPISIRSNDFVLLTVNGSPTISPSSRLPKDVIYKDIPNDITLPLVTRSDLRRYHIEFGDPNVDPVTIFNDSSSTLYAYKFHGIYPPGKDSDALLAEVELLNRIHSPHVLRPAFVVTDSTKSRFRGYLMPFLPAGTLSDVLRELSEPSARSDAPESRNLPILMLRPKGQFDTEQSAPMGVHFPTTKLAWTVKLTWAIEATIGVHALHEVGIYPGDIKLPNILLDQDGHLQLIDIYPTSGFTPNYAAPEVTIEQRWHSEARDIFALGMVLWSIAEEIWNFEREVQSVRPELVWRNGTDSTPQWFRDMVEMCLVEENKRPTAKGILTVLRAVH